jgi:hypothetical protein
VISIGVAMDEPGAAEIEVRVREEGITAETDLWGRELLDGPQSPRNGPAVLSERPHGCDLVSSPVLVKRLFLSDPGRIGKALALELPPL